MRLIREHVRLHSGHSFACLSLDMPEFDNAYHHHPEIELTWIEESHGQRLIGDAMQPFAPGDLVLIGANLPHHFRNWRPGRARAKVIQFRADAWGSHYFQLPEFHRISAMFEKASRGLTFGKETRAQVQRGITRLFEAAEGVPRLAALLEVLHGLSLDPQPVPIAGVAYSCPVNRQQMERLQRALNYIEQHWTEPLRVSDAARAASLHPQSMSRFFHQHLGVNFQAYLIRLRLTRAARLLLETDRTVADIAFSCGFNNLSNFNRHFHVAYERTPSEYRAGIG